eukprot:s194_g7.t1
MAGERPRNLLRVKDELLRGIVMQCSRMKPEDRPSAAQLLAHSWLKEDENAGGLCELLAPDEAPSTVPDLDIFPKLQLEQIPEEDEEMEATVENASNMPATPEVASASSSAVPSAPATAEAVPAIPSLNSAASLPSFLQRRLPLKLSLRYLRSIQQLRCLQLLTCTELQLWTVRWRAAKGSDSPERQKEHPSEYSNALTNALTHLQKT